MLAAIAARVNKFLTNALDEDGPLCTVGDLPTEPQGETEDVLRNPKLLREAASLAKVFQKRS